MSKITLRRFVLALGILLNPTPCSFVHASGALGWGDNTSGQLSFPSTVPYQAMAAGGFQTILAQPDGSILVVQAPSNYIVFPGTNGSRVVALAAGRSHGLALLDNGTPFGFGNDDEGQATIPSGITNLVAIGAGSYHSLGVLPDGTVVTWGGNYQNHRIVPAGLSNVVAVTGGYYHSLALRSDGAVVAWGLDTDGQTDVPAGLSNVVAIAAGSYHSLALRKDGSVVAWGRNDHGQILVPGAATNVVAIAAGYQHNLALRNDGTVLAWGDNHSGQCNPPSNLTNAISIAAGYQHSVALVGPAPWPAFESVPRSIITNSGSIFTLSASATGDSVQYQWQFDGQDLPGKTNQDLHLSNVQPLNAGVYTVIASANGYYVSARAVVALETPLILASPSPQTVSAGQQATFTVNAISALPLHYQWSFNGVDLPGATDPALIVHLADPTKAGIYQVLISTTAGSVISEPASLEVLSLPVLTASPISLGAVSGDTAQFSVTAVGTAPLSYQWFFNGQPIPQETNSLLSLVATNSGQIYVVVKNLYGSATSPVARLHVTVDGSIFVWGDSQNVVPPGLTGVGQFACGVFHVLALRTNGTLVAWGRNTSGVTNVPANLTNAIGISAAAHNLVLRSDGTVASWGFGTQGQTNVPPGLSNVVAVSAGTAFSLALKADGMVTAWGDNSHNQTNVPANVSNIVAIAAGEYHSIALKNDGTVVSWGQTNSPYHIPPPGLSNVIAIASGYMHSIALKDDGTVIAWGQNDSGQLNVPPGLTNVIAISAGGLHGLALRSDGTVAGLGTYNLGFDLLPPGLTNVSRFAAGPVLGIVQHGPPSWPLFSQPPQSRIASTGDSVAFSTIVSSAIPVTYQWEHNGSFLIGQTNSTLTLTNVQASNAGAYTVIVRGGGFAVTSTAQFALDTPLLVAATSIDQSILNSSTANFFVSAVARAPISYQWKLNGTVLPGQTNATVTIVNAQSGDAGVYSVLLTTVTTNLEVQAGQLTVRYPPTADPTPRKIVANAGDTVVLQPVVMGPGPFTYTWTLFGTVIANGPNPSLVLTNITFGNRYVVTIQNAGGIATNIFDLTVRLPFNALAEWDDFNPVIHVAPTNFASISIGFQHVLGALADGGVQAYGLNDFGQTTIPPDLHGVVQVAAGYSHSLALLNDGSVAGWGDNFSGQITMPSTATSLVAIAAGNSFSLGLRSDGAIVAWGDNTYGQTNAPAASALAISAGWHHALALKTDGTVLAWGDNSLGQAMPPDPLRNVVAVSAGGLHNLALLRDGTIFGWGDNSYGQITIPAAATNIVKIAAGYVHNLALRSDGIVIRWGRGTFSLHSTFVPESLAHISTIAAGYGESAVSTTAN